MRKKSGLFSGFRYINRTFDFLRVKLFYPNVMSKTKKTIILSERRETIRVSFGKRQPAFCEHCRTKTAWFSVAETALVSNFSEIEIFHFAESGKLHYMELDSGLMLVCGGSVETFLLPEKL